MDMRETMESDRVMKVLQVLRLLIADERDVREEEDFLLERSEREKIT